MEYIKGYREEESLLTEDGKKIKVCCLEVSQDDAVLNEWAAHFREQYRYLDALDKEREGTGINREDFLRDYVFPGPEKPGPSTRVGDFCEILVADYIEYIQNYYVPRIRYRSKFNRNTSPQGSDVLGFRLGAKASPKDEAIIFEVKGTSDPKSKKSGDQRLQEAIDHSNKDVARYAESLNAAKMRLIEINRPEEASIIARFQNITDKPYIIKYGASAVLTDQKYNAIDMADVTTVNHKEEVELLVLHTQDLRGLISELYRRAALC
ncbi:MAG: SAVED domain-containing protein [Lachnospiraceae bacterium]|nr:SAVED domain-containing protein [Lachnospiraceae bacterium]